MGRDLSSFTDRVAVDCHPGGVAPGAQDTDTAPAPGGAKVDQSFPERHAAWFVALGAILLVVAFYAAVPSFRHAVSLSIHGNLTGLRDYIRGLHAGGVALLFALMLLHAVIPYPSEIITTTAGFVYGFLPGTAVAILGWTIVAVITYGLGGVVGRPVLRAVLGRRFSDLERGMKSGGIRLMLVARLLPVVPLALLGYVAGATRESLWRLTWTSFLGYLPLTVAIAYLGSQAKSLSSSNPVVWLVVVVVVGLVVGSHFWARYEHKQAEVDGS
jgi:uncharacterized membrane protein YdjX (TVP38/TMEM64 family)